MMYPRILYSIPSNIAEEDCACPDTGWASASHFDSLSMMPWQTAPGLYRAPLPQQHELVFNPLGLANIAVLNPPAQALLDSFQQPRSLISTHALDSVSLDAVHQLRALEFIQPRNTEFQPLRTQPQTLTAWLHVTNACNLRCTYCYLNKTNSAMNDETGRAAIEAVFRSALHNGFSQVKLKYAGGEALLNFKLVMTLHQYALALAEQTSLSLREVVLSNGVALTRTMIEYLRDANIRLMISLDGVGAAHDAQRVFANSRGSFASVAHAVDRAIALNLLPHLSITVTANNADTLAEAVAFALERDLPFNLNFYRENDCSASHLQLAANQASIIAGMQAAFKAIETRLPRRRLIDGLVDRSSFAEPHEYACGVGHNYMVIDQHGKVARCQMEIERTITDVWANDPLDALRRDATGFQNVKVTAKEGCRDCTWRYWCAGGCSLLTFRTTGRTDVQSPNCNIYQALYPEILRLEGLRLLHHAA